jgi:hypothetical protein
MVRVALRSFDPLQHPKNSFAQLPEMLRKVSFAAMNSFTALGTSGAVDGSGYET